MNDLTNLTDIDLLKYLPGKGRKSKQAFLVLYERYAGKLRMFCGWLCHSKDLADELSQDVWLEFFKAIKNGYDVKNVPGLLFTIARSQLKKQKIIDDKVRYKSYDQENLELLLNRLNHENHYDLRGRKRLDEALNKAINELPGEMKEIFILKKYNNFTYDEIADICETTIDKAKKSVQKSNAILRKILAPLIKDTDSYK